jgi:hypothetical protein
MRAYGILLASLALSCSSGSSSSTDAGPGAGPEAGLDAGLEAGVEAGSAACTDGASSLLAPAGDAAQTAPVDGISCDTSEQLLFHIHAHLAIYAGDCPKLLAAGVGIGPPLTFQDDFVVGGSCFSWLHTHDESGIIHIESPIQRTYTLGDFFDVWGLPLSATQVGPLTGAVTAYLDGQPFTGDPRNVPLDAHAVVQLDVGTPLVAPQPYTFPSGY